MNMQVRDARRDVRGGWKVDVNRGERIEPDHVVVAEALRPGRIERPHRVADARTLIAFHRVALAIMEPDGFDPGKARQRPGKTHGRILAAGKQNKSAFRRNHRGRFTRRSLHEDKASIVWIISVYDIGSYQSGPLAQKLPRTRPLSGHSVPLRRTGPVDDATLRVRQRPDVRHLLRAQGKSKIAKFSVSRSGREVRGMTIAPSCRRKRRLTCAAVLPCAAPIFLSTSLPAVLPLAIGL